MDLLELIKNDHSLANDLKQFCDIEILPLSVINCQIQ